METFLTVAQQYIDPAMAGVVLVLWFIGYGLKQTPKVPNWSILWVIVVLGIVTGFAILGPNANGFIQGVLAAALAILGHQVVKQTSSAIKES